MHFNRFDLNLLVALDALLQDKNVTRASERLFMSQPAMSGALQRLRERFDDPLLVRVGRTMELTPKAKLLIKPVREILLRVQNTLEAEPNFDPATARRSFRILMSDFVAVTFMPEIMRRISEDAPGIKIRIAPIGSSVHEQLESGEASMVIRARVDPAYESQALSGNLVVEPLFTDTWVCVCDTDHPTIGDELTLDEYVQLPHVSINFGRPTPMLEDLSYSQASLDINVRATVPNFATLAFMLPGTPLLTVLPSRMAGVLRRYVNIKVMHPPIEIAPLDELLIWHKRDEEDAGHLWLREMFRELASKLE